ncbi:MAG: suppressor of fused domain protein [Ketobacteraceae bacterium]|nr:suppressor of fused domain protein [Ketobacteraceae bacterium]
MKSNPATLPSERMKALFEHFADQWGEPEHLIWFDPEDTNVPGSLEKLHVGVWPAADDCEVNAFVTFGMSDLKMPGDVPYAELQFAVRGQLTTEELHEGARFLANLAEFPFHNRTGLDWWRRISQAGEVPFFPQSSGILFRPPFSEDDCAEFTRGDDVIRFLFVVPMTPEENALLEEQGIDAYEEYMINNQLDPLGHR